MNDAKIEPPRWPGGPPICKAENLPAFETAGALADFHDRNGPGVNVTKKAWQCQHCGGWHHGTGAEVERVKNDTGWRPHHKSSPFLRASTEKAIDDRRRAAQGLDLQTTAKPQRTVPLPRQKPKEGALF